MITRSYDVSALTETMQPYLPILGFEPEDWLGNPLNVALTDGQGNYSLFERESRGLVSGHYFMVARGKDALKLSKEMLHEIFTGPYDVEAIKGLTPLDHRGALWMNKQLGFKSYGVFETPPGLCELVILTKKEFLNG